MTLAEERASDRPLLQALPSLAQKLRFAPLAQLPTPLEPMPQLAAALGRPEIELWEKRDDLTSPHYGGNKVRTLEVLLGRALDQGHQRVFATGAYGSNHAIATAIHAPRLGLTAGAALYPQPPFPAAKENLRWLLALRPRPQLLNLPHWSALPFGMANLALAARREGTPTTIMEPGGAVPWGALGYVSAGLELAQQVAAGAMPCPQQIVVPVGSNCTTAGLLVGFELAARLGIGFAAQGPPRLYAVRVTPWPVTTRWRILRLARATCGLLWQLSADAVTRIDAGALGARLQLDTGQLGRGYGFASGAGQQAVALWDRHVGHPLETTYSGKAAAAMLALARTATRGPLLFWSTKSSSPAPQPSEAELSWGPHPMRAWLRS